MASLRREPLGAHGVQSNAAHLTRPHESVSKAIGRIDRVIHPSGAVEEIGALETVGLVTIGYARISRFRLT